MKIALCFIINYEHILNKEDIWREWIEPNKDIINTYFFYKDIRRIKSKWILEHTIPPKLIVGTSYYNVVPAYLSIMSFAFSHDQNNEWFCLLTDSCCPIISPKKFRYLFYKYYTKSIFSWKNAWWNTKFHKRANLDKIHQNLRLANDPWFVLKREHVQYCIRYINQKNNLVKTVCSGGLANESLFAIILYIFGQLNNNSLICSPSHIVDWYRMTSSTSPHVFTEGNTQDKKFIEQSLKENTNIMFIRKISQDFPDDVLKSYIYKHSIVEDDRIILKDPFYYKKILIQTKELFMTFFSIGLIFFLWDHIERYYLKSNHFHYIK
jgi:hypothetical protein